MEVVHERCAGMDISKKDVKVCVRIPSTRRGQFHRTVTTYGSTTNEVLRLRGDLADAGVTLVVMEATGDYWKPFFFVLQDVLNVQLVNAKQAKNIPGRKTDVSDATWLADLAAHGLLRESFVPEQPIRQLRDLTRTRAHLVEEKTREYSRMEKALEDAGIKLSSVVSSLTLVSCRRILDALVAGERDPETLTLLVAPGLRKKSAELIEALTGRFTEHHAFMVRLHLDTIDYLEAAIKRIEDHLDQVINPFRNHRNALTSIPGIGEIVANVVIAEIGIDMTVFPTAANLASWAGVCPGQNESAGRIKSTKTRPGNRYLKAALGVAVFSISNTKDNRLAVRYHRLCARRGPLKATVALEHTLLIIIWNMLKNGVAYNELGADYYTRINPERVKSRALRQLKDLGFDVTLAPTEAA